MIPGFKDALLQMQKGGSYTVDIPSELAYGAEPPQGAPIPPNADLVFEIELIDFMSRDEAEERYNRMMQAMQAMQAGQGGPPDMGQPRPAQ